MKKLLIVTYVFVGLFVAIHQDAFQRHCKRDLPVFIYVAVGVLWPAWMVLSTIIDTIDKSSFECAP